jgi:hypothetical protein
MMRGFTFLLLFQLVGEVLARGLALSAPAPVIGLALLGRGAAASAVRGVERDRAPVDARDAGAELGVQGLLGVAEEDVAMIDDPVDV